MEYKVLDRVNSPEDVKKLKKDEISALSSEIRSFLVENVERTGGHLASNLGAVELSLAIHRVFDSPKFSYILVLLVQRNILKNKFCH